jgi:uncharacterized protein HemX
MSETNPEPKASTSSAHPDPPRPVQSEIRPTTPEPEPKASGGKRWLLILVGALAIYLAGFLPPKLKLRQFERNRESDRTELRLNKVQLSLASAALDARRGEYELARQEAAAFFTALDDELNKTNSGFSAEQRAALEELMRQRDELITLLARSDPASAERLANLHVAFRQAGIGAR